MVCVSCPIASRFGLFALPVIGYHYDTTQIRDRTQNEVPICSASGRRRSLFGSGSRAMAQMVSQMTGTNKRDRGKTEQRPGQEQAQRRLDAISHNGSGCLEQNGAQT